MPNNIIYQGAEAILTKTTYHNLPAVQKQRIPKSYRIKEIDTPLITYRTKEEAKLIIEARSAGVPVPLIYDIDQKNGILLLEYLSGPRIKDILNNLENSVLETICQKIGKNIAMLHNHDLIHGDITTSNMIYQDTQIFFIDFGLGSKTTELEAKGVDLHVLMEAFESTHSQKTHCFSWVMDGYRTHYTGKSKAVEQKIHEIVKRGRYR
ncbi:MAG: Kae1-associated serine/threonine protein kinase [Candidatus Thermoplasmatota archaeon]|nr:Kae1-associated serine/threonine protein kinase [Candidatus Thermoplasmatota archaeon]MBU1940281.1 Kae1-associated serine/threonine protein kinase [Candidatus Thermoplasmatota archaeon]